MSLRRICRAYHQGRDDMTLWRFVGSRSRSDVVGETCLTTLNNGLKIVSQSSQREDARVALVIQCGTMYEGKEKFGATELVKRMAFYSTYKRSSGQIELDLEKIGGCKSCSTSRDHMIYTIKGRKFDLPLMVDLLVDNVRNPVFFELEVQQKIQGMAEASCEPRYLLLDALHAAGYIGALANPVIAPKSTLDRLNATTALQFVTGNFTASRMVLAASGVDHKELVKYVEPLVIDMPSVLLPKEAPSVYVGGQRHISADSELTYIALAFELPGGWQQLKHAITLMVLQILLGGFQSGGGVDGRGKGLHSWPYVRVLNKYPAVESYTTFSSIYSDTGLFGIIVSTESKSIPQAVDVAVKELICVTKPSGIVRKELKDAKLATKGEIMKNLESGVVELESMAKQVLMYGERIPLDQILETIDKISREDVAYVAQKLISSPLAMASLGEDFHVPAYESLSRLFHVK
ncbi:mitochondrial-processing peptidase subunit alpha [Daucus carota subsp. sativus]|uniref:mitochondrial-processing peptidase subunit alpha n=1 Tax=Daucus carota subsp. sativus TaxID=79200 RepID=UPI0007B234F6|nr:PREDICTED: mitochondrial-processing peptidase subunit alpha-like [Daucus carota subsp. sativus]